MIPRTNHDHCFEEFWLGISNLCRWNKMVWYLVEWSSFHIRILQDVNHLSSTWFKSITLDSGIDVGQEINIGPRKFSRKNKRRALNNHRAWKILQKFEGLCNEKPDIFFFSFIILNLKTKGQRSVLSLKWFQILNLEEESQNWNIMVSNRCC